MNSTNKNNSNVVESENIIELKNITKQYEDLVVLDNLNLDIKKNEFLTLLGPSGCGKTTTLKIIAGFEHADEGEVMFEGENVNDTPPYERQVNTVFQKYALFPHMNVYENIAFGLKIKKMDKKTIDEIVKKMLIIVVILTSVATALVGPITFLGLLVVNIARQVISSYKHSILGVATILISIVSLVGGQLVVEQLMNFGVSVSIIINFVGGIYFIYLVMKERNR